MYKFFAILPLFLLSVQATGKFSVLEHPKSLEFKGNEKIDSAYVGDVLCASLGLYVDTESKWGGLYINNPFELPKVVINVLIEGVKEIHLNEKSKTFSLFGDSSRDSLNVLSSTVEALNSPVINVDLNKGLDSLLTFTDILGNLQIPTTLKSTSNLKPDDYPEDKLVLQQIAAINALSTKMIDIEKKPSLITIRLSLKPLIDAHGANSPAIVETLKSLNEAILNFAEESRKAYSNELLFTVVADDNTSSRQKRNTDKESATISESAQNLNLATHYKENYPIIFNIILWFMVVFVFSLIAISYVIATMDPGRDSIIYRMTSTRMKKDN